MRRSLGFFEKIEFSARLPVTHDDFWRVLLELDQDGPWSASDFAGRTNLNPGTPRIFLRGLKAAGYVVQVGSRTTRGKNPQQAPLYRLTSRPIDVPRVRRDGSAVPERQNDRIWRAMKMAKVFTLAELCDLISDDGKSANRSTIHGYVRRLALTPVLTEIKGKKREITYRLAVNLGAKAPRVLATKVVYDPNSKTVIGAPEVREVAS